MLLRFTRTVPSPPGVEDSLNDVFRALASYLGLRWALFGSEARQAAGPLAGIIAASVLFMFSFFIAYVAAWMAVVFWAAHSWLDGNPALPMCVAGGIHLAAAAGLLLRIRRRARSLSLFNGTQREFEEDKRWLNTRTTPRN